MTAAATTLRPAGDADRAQILAWRNHPAVRRVMFTDHLIAAEEHARWWQRVQASPDHQVLVLHHAGLDCGVVTFTREPATPGTWLWGFYLDPDAFPLPAEQLRAWSGMEQQSLAWADQVLQAARLRCEVFAFNAGVLAMHRRHGFTECHRYTRPRGEQTLAVVQLYRDRPCAGVVAGAPGAAVPA